MCRLLTETYVLGGHDRAVERGCPTRQSYQQVQTMGQYLRPAGLCLLLGLGLAKTVPLWETERERMLCLGHWKMCILLFRSLRNRLAHGESKLKQSTW